jgi:hypothetical protein
MDLKGNRLSTFVAFIYMPDCLASSQPGTGIKKYADAGTSPDAVMPMPAASALMPMPSYFIYLFLFQRAETEESCENNRK